MKTMAASRRTISRVEEEKYLRNRAKVERIKAKVKIRFKLRLSADKMTLNNCDHSKFALCVVKILPLLIFLIQLQVSDCQIVSSELSFEFLNLKSIPSEQMCEQTSPWNNQVNSLSLANNQISQLHSSAFTCLGKRLRILDLANNRIQLISNDTFEGLTQLEVLRLDANELEQIPATSLNRLSATLRHLFLANNRIHSIDWLPSSSSPSTPLLNLTNLISLDLRSNPLEQIHERAFEQLGQLKTLKLSQTRWNFSSRARPFEGLPELRYLHLNQLNSTNLTSLEAREFCHSSRKLSKLSLESNQLERVPQLGAHCEALLSIDLSHNQIAGSLAANFSQLPNLIDLYLGHNRLESLESNAFDGLVRLQVLVLESNQLKTIHTSAFLPIRTTLIELNLAHNLKLTQIVHLQGLDRLTTFKSYGNPQLRTLPHFRRAKLLAFTYAYHCCDYLDTSKPEVHRHNLSTLHRAANLYNNEESPPLMQQLSFLILEKLSLFFTNNRLPAPRPTTRQTPPGDYASQDDDVDDDRVPASPPGARDDDHDDEANAKNISELVLWPPSDWPPEVARQRVHRRGRHLPPEAITRPHDYKVEAPLPSPPGAVEVFKNRTPAQSYVTARESSSSSSSSSSGQEKSELIDELIWQIQRIRFQHAVGRGRHHDGRRRSSGADGWVEISAARTHHGKAHLHLRHADARRVVDLEEDDDEWLVPLFSSSTARKHSSSSQNSASSSDDDDVIGDYSPATIIELVAKKLLAMEEQLDSRGLTRRERSSSNKLAHVQCLPEPNAFQPCHDLFESIWLRAGIWLVFCFAFVGNILVIIVLASVRPSSSTASALTSIMWFNAAQSKRHIDVPRFLVLNLAIADLLMACYLGLLAFVDFGTLGEFRLYAITWQYYSNYCQLAGFLAVLSSELSVFILAIITLERNYAITNAVHLNRRLSLQKAMLIMLIGYIYALTMAVLPLYGINNYRKFSICLPLEFHSQKSLWFSSANAYLSLLISINTLSFILLVGCYLRMYCAIRGSQAWNTNDLKIAKRMSILVITDFMCWIPLICVASFALLGQTYLVGPNGLKVLIIFVLPLNSVANPFLYAITTKKFKRDLNVLKKRLQVDRISRWFRLLLTCGRARKENAIAATASPSPHIRRRQQHKSTNHRQMIAQTHQVLTSGPPHKRQSRNRGVIYSGLDGAAATEPPANGSADERRRDDKRTNDHRLMVPNVHLRRRQSLLARTISFMRGAESRPADLINTNYQVTLNKTTCLSCQQKLADNNNNNNNNSNSSRYENVVERLQKVDSIVTNSSNKPQIVLDILRNQVHEDDDQMEAECSLNIIAPGGESTLTPAEFVELQRRAAAEQTTSNALLVNSAAAFNERPRPHSADMMARGWQAQNRTVNPRIDQLEDPANRSVSACAYDWPCNNNNNNNNNNIANINKSDKSALTNELVPMSARPCSCSCQAIGGASRLLAAPTSSACSQLKTTKSAAANQRSSRSSISRLVVEPIARAWSSLQLSMLQMAKSTSSTLQTAGEQRDLQKDDELRLTRRAKTNRLILCDDVYVQQMTSPVRRRLFEQRRMSRSCELISCNSSARGNAEHSTSSNGAGQTTASTSLYDQHDDQRFLLDHTFNQPTMTTTTTTTRRMTNANQTASVGRRKHTRCSSWPPGLLEKLEDCVQQIKSRMPKLINVSDDDDDDDTTTTLGDHHQAIMQQSTSDSRRVPADNVITMLSSSSDSLSGHNSENDDDEVDQLNELDFVQWTRNMRARAMPTASRRHRLHQQLSANSDTLSARTVGTTLTSLSFDSSTNIHAIACNQQAQQNTNEDQVVLIVEDTTTTTTTTVNNEQVRRCNHDD